jgi:hypothetical protein
MQLSRRAFSVSGLSLVALAVTIAACSDRNPAGPLPEPIVPPGVRPIAALECEASILERQVTCRAPAPNLGDARGDIIVGGQNLYVTMAASNITNSAGIFAFDATLTNLIPQPMGTEDGVNPAAQGIRVFFHTGPTRTAGSGGDVTVDNPDGHETFTASNQPFFRYSEILEQNETSSAKNWQIAYDPGVDAFAFTLYVSAPVQYEDGWIAVTPASSTILPGDTAYLSGTIYDFVGRIYGDPITWESDPDSVATVDSNGRVAGERAGMATITATATITLPGRGPVVVSGTAEVIVNTPLTARDTTYEAIGNFTVDVDSVRGLENVVEDPDGDPVTFVAGTVTTAEGGSVTFATNGSFSYLSAPGFVGRDSVQYIATDGVDQAMAWLKLVSETRYWYVEAGAESAGATGTDAAPFPALAGAAGVWAAGDTTLVRSGDASTIQGGVTLLDDQAILGEGIGTDFTVELNGVTTTLLAAGTAPAVGRSSAGATITLGENNVLRGLAIGSSDGAAIAGTAFGTLTTGELYVSATGPALSLENGTLAGAFAQLSSTNSTGRGLSLVNVAGSLAPAAGGISGAAGAGVYVEGGTVTVSYPGDVTNSAGRSVHVTGRTEGAVTFSGDISDTGTGILVTGNSGGTVSFTGASKSLSTGTNPAVTLSSNTGATVVFRNGGLDIETTTGTGFSATGGGTVAVYDGASNDDVAVSGAAASALVLNGVSVSADGISFATVSASGTTTGPAINVDALDGSGTLSIASAQVAATAAGQAGIRIASNAAPVTIASATVNGTGGAGILVSSNSGAVTVSGGSIGATTAPAGAGIALVGGTGDVTIANSVTKASAGRIADVQDRSAGTVNLTGAMSCTTDCTGILAQNNSGGVINFNATSKVLTTGANQAVTLANNGGATIGFGGGGLAITTTTGTGFGSTGGGTVTVTGANNTVASGTGTAVSLAGTTISGTGVTFRSVSASGGASGIVLNGTGANTFAITGDGATPGSGGTIASAAAGSGVSLTNTGNTNLDYLTVNGAGTGILGSSFGTLNVTGTSAVSTGAPALNLATGTVSGTFPTVSASGSSAHGVSLNGVAGTWAVAGGTVTGSANGAALFVTGNQGGGTLNWQAALAQANAHPALSVATHTNGTLNVTGAVSGTGTSTGLRFSDADAHYNVSPSGATTLSGSGGAVVILSGSSGTFVFSGNLNASYASGSVAPFSVNGSNPSVTFNGNLTTNGATGRLVDVTNQSGGSITFQNGTLSATSGTGILLSNAAGTVNFNGTTTLNGGDAGVDITNLSNGSFSFGSGASITNPSGIAFDVNGGSPTITYAGSITHNSGRAVSVQNMGGTATFSGNISGTGASASGILVHNSGANVTFSGATKSLSTQGNGAVTLTNNSGSILFSGGNLAITTTSGAGFSATGGGTVQVTGANNTIASGTGTALNVQNTTIGASGLTFVSIGSTGGTNAIVLNNTGATNGLLVTGTGSAGSGGTISGASANQISLTSARNVSLSHMIIQNGGESGIYGSNLTNFRLKNSTVSGNGNAVGEAGLEFENLLGTDSILNTVVTGSAEDNLVVRNTSGTLDSLVVLGSTFSSNSSLGNDGILVTASNTANVTVRVRGNTFTANRGDHFQATASNSANLNVVLSGNSMSGGHATALGQGITLGNGLTHTGTFTYDIHNNQIPGGPISNAITVNHAGTTGSVMQGRIRNNTIGTSGVDLSCSTQASGIAVGASNRGTHTVAVTSNTVRRCYDRGIDLNLVDGSPVTVNATITGNTVNELTAAFARQALYVNVGAFDPNFLGVRDNFTVCADIQSNNLTPNPGYATEAIRLRMRFDSRMNLPGYTGPFDNGGGQVDTYLAGRNTLTGSATATTTATGSPYGYYNAGASCPTPP